MFQKLFSIASFFSKGSGEKNGLISHKNLSILQKKKDIFLAWLPYFAILLSGLDSLTEMYQPWTLKSTWDWQWWCSPGAEQEWNLSVLSLLLAQRQDFSSAMPHFCDSYICFDLVLVFSFSGVQNFKNCSRLFSCVPNYWEITSTAFFVWELGCWLIFTIQALSKTMVLWYVNQCIPVFSHHLMWSSQWIFHYTLSYCTPLKHF